MSFAAVFTTAVAAVGLVFYGVYRWALPRPIPGIHFNPKAVKRLWGDIPDVITEMQTRGDLVAWLIEENLKSPNIVNQIFLRPFSKPMVVIGDALEARDLQINRTKDFDRSSELTDLFGPLVRTNQILHKTGPEWKMHRRLVQDTMTPRFLNEVVAPTIYSTALRFIELWKIKTALARGRPFPAMDDMVLTTLDAVLAFSFGPTFPESAMQPQIEGLKSFTVDFSESNASPVSFPRFDLGKDVNAMFRLTEVLEGIQSDPFPKMKWWFVKMMSPFRTHERTKDACIRREIERAIDRRKQQVEGVDDSWVRSTVDHVIDREQRLADKTGRKPDLCSPAIMDELYGLIVAGGDTTSTTLAWGVKYLADHPTVQTRLREALVSGFPEAVAKDRLPYAGEIIGPSIPYLDATLEEILRVAPTAAVGTRQATQDTTLLGSPIPKDTIVLYFSQGPGYFLPSRDIDQSRRSPRSLEDEKTGRIKAWNNDDISLFKPERWLVKVKADDSDAEDRVVFDSQAGPINTFGLGPRSCFGKRLAYVDLKIMLVLLLWNFELLPCGEGLSSYGKKLVLTGKPHQCYARLREVRK